MLTFLLIIAFLILCGRVGVCIDRATRTKRVPDFVDTTSDWTACAVLSIAAFGVAWAAVTL